MKLSKHANQALTIIAGATTAVAVSRHLLDTVNSPRQWWQNRNTHYVNIDARDPSFGIVLRALETRFSNVFDRSTLLYTTECNSRVAIEDTSDWYTERFYKVHRYFDGDVTVNFTLDGYKVRVKLTKGEEDEHGRNKSRPTLTFLVQSSAAKKAVENYLTNIIETHERSKPMLRALNTWGNWETIREAPIRKLEHVALANGHKDAIVSDMERFLRSEDRYALISRHYSRGYLFHGPPGTGKTSTAKALADHFKMDIYYLNLADIKSDGALHGAISEISPRSMLVLEDIDSVHAATDRDQDSNKVTTTGLLNALDGLLTPHGMVSIITTNKRDELDEALTREGRIDMEVEFGFATSDQLIEMWRSTIGTEPPLSVDSYVGRPPSAFMEVIGRALDGVTL